MSDIYGKLTEHPDLPIEDPGRFTVEIKPHDYEAPGARRDPTGRLYVDPFCRRCGFHRFGPIHPREEV